MQITIRSVVASVVGYIAAKFFARDSNSGSENSAFDIANWGMSSKCPPAQVSEQKITQQEIRERLREIARCDQFGWPLSPGMSEWDCYVAASDLDGDVDVGGVVLSDEARAKMGAMDWDYRGQLSGDAIMERLALEKEQKETFVHDGAERLLNEDPAEYGCQKCRGNCGGRLCADAPLHGENWLANEREA